MYISKQNFLRLTRRRDTDLVAEMERLSHTAVNIRCLPHRHIRYSIQFRDDFAVIETNGSWTLLPDADETLMAG